ncbi:hypothetical protein BV902_17555 [Sphingobacterium sp. B29]|nr:hypothetical protein BV902_17555 [Sphingobacterium sp. B29]
MYGQITVHDKSMGMKDYHLYSKNGLAFYVFRKSQEVWQLSFGVLADDIKEACIDALILRFDKDVPELFYHHVKRQVVEVCAKKNTAFGIFINVGFVCLERFCLQLLNFFFMSCGKVSDSN